MSVVMSIFHHMRFLAVHGMQMQNKLKATYRYHMYCTAMSSNKDAET